MLHIQTSCTLFTDETGEWPTTYSWLLGVWFRRTTIDLSVPVLIVSPFSFFTGIGESLVLRLAFFFLSPTPTG